MAELKGVLVRIFTAMKSEKSQNFRTDIVGLRGVAVLAVLLHHFEIPGFVGAFYGPDIFFVLSGFLITGSLVKEYSRNLAQNLDKGKISIGSLYFRRIRRIFPASVFVILIVNVYAFFFINSVRAAEIRTDSIWTLLFGANLRFIQTSTDYFSSGVMSPFVHFWSLSVTEQFYLVWPFVILLVAQWPMKRDQITADAWQKRIRNSFVLIIITSFIWSLLVFTESPNRAYFSTFCRAWELALGGLISIISAKSLGVGVNRYLPQLRIFAVAVLFGSCVFVRPENFGYTIFIPTLAATFLILTGTNQKSDLSYRILGSKLLVAIGTISYSMYLWHWPIFVFGRDLGLLDSLVGKGVGIAITIALAILTFYLIEQPFMRIPVPKLKKRADSSVNRNRSKLHLKVISSFIAFMILLFLGPAMVDKVFRKNVTMTSPNPSVAASKSTEQIVARQQNLSFEINYGVSNLKFADERWKDAVSRGASLSSLPRQILTPINMLSNPAKWQGHGFDCMAIRQRDSDNCLSGSNYSNQEPNAPKVVVLGGSFVEALVPGIFTAFNPNEFNIRGYIMDQCAVADVTSILFSGEDYPECKPHRDWSFKQISQLQPEYVVISANARNLFKEERSVFGQRLIRSLAKLSKSGAKVVLIGTLPHSGNLSQCLVGKSRLSPKCFGTAHEDRKIRGIEKNAIEAVGGIYIDPTNWVCYKDVCPPVIGNMIVTWDGSHMTTWFAKAIGPLLRQELVQQGVLD